VSTGLEQRLRDELRVLADRVGIEDVRPLRQPRRGARHVSAQWLAPVAAMAAIALVTGGLMVARNELHASASASASAGGLAAPVDPRVIAVAASATSGAGSVIKLISVRDGTVVKAFPQRAASGGSGLALSPDGSVVFLASEDVPLSEIPVAAGRPVSLGPGAFPSVSPDSEYVAYATGAAQTKVAIRNLRTGHTRKIDLAGVLGASSSLVDLDSVAWLGDGSQLIAVPQPVSMLTRRDNAKTVTACGQQDSPRGLCVVVINVGRELTVHRVFVRGVTTRSVYLLLGGDLTARRAFYVALRAGNGEVIDRVAITGDRAAARPIATVPRRAFVQAIAPDGDRIIYEPSSSRPSLWVGTITHGQVTSRRRLFSGTSQFVLYQVAW
jgi:hypothetical protein